MEIPHVYLPVLGYVLGELIANCVIVFLVIAVVSLRVVGRLMGPGLSWDDYFVVACVVCFPVLFQSWLALMLTNWQPMGIGMLVCQGLCK